MTTSAPAPDWGRRIGIDALWTEIRPNLWLGGTADDDTVADPRDGIRKMDYFDIFAGQVTDEHFDAVVTVYAWAQPVDWNVEELRYGFYDGVDAVDPETLTELANWAYRRWSAGKRVLIRCQAGLNRSSLVMALVLMRDGASATEAITEIRSRRSRHCLNNSHFVDLIYSHSMGLQA